VDPRERIEEATHHRRDEEVAGVKHMDDAGKLSTWMTPVELEEWALLKD